VQPVVTTISPRPVQCRSGEPNDRELLGRVYRQARCARSCLDPDEWFPLTADVARAREQAARAIAICAGCPVRADCLELSLRHSFGIGAHGVWGGLVAEERRELRRRRRAADSYGPEVSEKLEDR
jgi:WhiB family transcriptional regulator, redox-sensing transcriptional regulator